MAAKKKKSRSAMANVIADTLTELNNGEFPDDPTLNDEGQEISGPEKFVKGQKRKDEVIIDELWGGIVGKEGYFVKIKKEIRPNEWMMMKTVENDWRQWADIETAIFDLVRDHTKRWPHKWGSGLYRVEMTCRGGMRGQKYPIHDVYVNADEELQAMNPAAGGGAPEVGVRETVGSKLEELSTFMDVVRDFMPKAADPVTVQTQIAQALQQGMQIKSSENNNTAQMMQAMMTGMMGMITAVLSKNDNRPGETDPMKHLNGMLDSLKTFGVLGNNNQAKEKTAIDFARELRELGMDLFKREDPMEQVKKLKEIANVAVQMVGLSGDGEKPSIFERVIDMAVPMLPQVVDSVKQTMEKAVEAQKIAGQNIEKAAMANRRMIVAPQQTPMSSIPDEEKTTLQRMQEQEAKEKMGQPSNLSTGKVEDPQVKMFFDQIYANVTQNNRMFYPVIYTMLMQDTNGLALIQGISAGQQGANELINLLMQHGDDRFRNPDFVNKYLMSYANGFVLWLQNMMGSNITQTVTPQQPAQNGSINGVKMNGEEYQVECMQCGTVYGFATKQEFDNEPEKVCGAEIEGGQTCPGELTPIVKV